MLAPSSEIVRYPTLPIILNIAISLAKIPMSDTEFKVGIHRTPNQNVEAYQGAIDPFS